jgi:putative copper export protein
MPAAGAFDAGSPAYAAVRWLGFVAMLGLIGAVAFARLVVPAAARRGAPDAWVAIVQGGARRVGLLAAASVIAAALLRLAAQDVAMHGADGSFDASLVRSMVIDTSWGAAWLIQIAAAGVALIGLALARRGAVVAWTLAAAGAVGVAASAALSGHAAAVPRATALAVLADAAHVLGAGGWLGTLLLVTVVALPAALRLDAGERGPAAAAAVNAFSPIALTCAGLVALTGVASAWMHLGGVSALWGTSYGRTLLVKLAVLSLVAATAFYNWRRVRPALGDETGARRVRRSSAAELAVGALVLAVTAVLVATPTHTP